MPNRYQTVTRTWIYRFLALRDGEACLKCHKPPTKVKLTIDHADGNHFNNDPDNLSLFCQGCNNSMRKLSPLLHRKLVTEYRATCVCVCDKSHVTRVLGCSGTRQGETELNKSLIDYNQGSIEMRANGIFEIRFREWIIEVIKAQGSYLKKEAVASGAEIVGCSPSTISRYLDKLTSESGVLAEQYNSLRQTILVFRSTDYAALERETEADLRERLQDLKAVALSAKGNGGNGHSGNGGNGH